MKSFEIWQAGDGYEKHRIPGLLVTERGTLLMYHEARYEKSDWALMDILLCRSEDFGRTVSDATVLARGTEEIPTVNNPVMLQDKSGRIHFLYCENYGVCGGKICRRYSDDDGITWSESIDITEYTAPDFRNAFAFGPGHGICTEEGVLIVPIWMVPKSYSSPVYAHSPSVVSTFYSTDNGASWRLGDVLGSNYELQSPNESSIVELPNGNFYINMRCMNYCRAKAYSNTGYSDWQDYGIDKGLIDPRCFGSAAVYCLGDVKVLLFANCESQGARKNVVIKASLNSGKTWEYRYTVDEERGGYVELNVDNRNGNIYVLYENNGGDSVILSVLDNSWIEEVL